MWYTVGVKQRCESSKKKKYLELLVRAAVVPVVPALLGPERGANSLQEENGGGAFSRWRGRAAACRDVCQFEASRPARKAGG